jgi:hypothetical protein
LQWWLGLETSRVPSVAGLLMAGLVMAGLMMASLLVQGARILSFD